MTETSQHQIESYIERLLPNPGYFLELGCWHGTLISQTAYLERVKGWKGTAVDPFPRGFEGRTCRVVPMAISKDGLPREFVKVTIDRRYGGDVSYFSGFKDAVKAHWELIRQFCDYTIIQVPTITIDDLYSYYRLPAHIDFLSVDTEGSEEEIFASIDFDKLSFGLIVFEHNEDEGVKQRIGKLLTERGYKLYESLRVDDIYVHGKLSND